MNNSVSSARDRILQIISDCPTNFKECYNEGTSKVAYQQYGYGGECLHRGYYCPSLIYDIIVGNVSRGRVSNRAPSANNSTFKYGFDHNNKLILVEQPHQREIIFHKEHSEIGIGLCDDMKIQFVSECQFKGEQICLYTFCLYNPYDESIVELTEEKYEYLDDQLRVIWSRTFQSKDKCVTQIEKYNFSVENGYLVSYRVQEYDENGLEKNECDSRAFKVRLKRKI